MTASSFAFCASLLSVVSPAAANVVLTLGSNGIVAASDASVGRKLSDIGLKPVPPEAPMLYSRVMKLHLPLLFPTVFLAGTVLAQAQNPLSSEVKWTYGVIKNNLLKLAEKMPA